MGKTFVLFMRKRRKINTKQHSASGYNRVNSSSVSSCPKAVLAPSNDGLHHVPRPCGWFGESFHECRSRSLGMPSGGGSDVYDHRLTTMRSSSSDLPFQNLSDGCRRQVLTLTSRCKVLKGTCFLRSSNSPLTIQAIQAILSSSHHSQVPLRAQDGSFSIGLAICHHACQSLSLHGRPRRCGPRPGLLVRPTGSDRLLL